MWKIKMKQKRFIKNPQNNKIELVVKEAYQNDIRKNIVRLNYYQMNKMDVKLGDFIFIKGKRETIAIAELLPHIDANDDIIRLSSLTMDNAKTSPDEIVEVYKAMLIPAEEIVMELLSKNIQVNLYLTNLNEKLWGKPIIKGDIILLNRSINHILKDEFSNMMENIMDFSDSGFNNLKYRISSVIPPQPCYINENTKITIEGVNTHFPENTSYESFLNIVEGKNNFVRINKLPKLDSLFELYYYKQLFYLVNNKRPIHFYTDENYDYFIIGKCFYKHKKIKII